jgi:Reverse transcriptase (RNA-dependent DNA polymerase)
MHLVKKSLPLIAEPLIHIFNLSLLQGVVPDKFKIAKVIPVFKSGNPQDMNNYRPISLLCSFSKILEKIVFIRLMKYLNNYNLLSSNQFGFRPKHSTYHPMLNILNTAMSALNKKQHMLIIFCDLKKAFDTCNVDILLKKLQKLGIINMELAWFKSYLTNRWQFVSINEKESILL